MRHLVLGGLCVLTLVLSACNITKKQDPTAPPPEVSSNEDLGVANPIPTTIEPRDYHLGSDSAPVTIIMYGDFQCLRCQQYAQNLEILRGEFPNELQIIWRHLPDTQTHDKAALALQASEAAAMQGHFWDMHAVLFTSQESWVDLNPEAFRAKLDVYAQIIGLDMAEFTAGMDDGRYAGLVEAYQTQSNALGIVGIPTLLINGEPLNDRDDLFGLRGAINLALLQQNGYDNAPPMQLVV